MNKTKPSNSNMFTKTSTKVLGAIVFMIGCGGGEEGTTLDRAAARVDFHVRTMFETTEGSVGPETGGVARVAVNSEGLVLFTGGFLQQGEDLVGVLDSTGSLVSSFGAAGDGPGELPAVPYTIGLVGDTALIVDQSPPRIHRLNLSGRYLGYFGFPPTAQVAGLESGPTMLQLFMEMSGSDISRRLDWVDLNSGNDQVLVAASDPLLQEINAQKRFGQALWTAYASPGPGRAYVGDGLTYRIGYYVAGELDTVFGRRAGTRSPNRRELERLVQNQAQVPPSRRRTEAQLSQDSVPYFGALSMDFDSAGRLWVVGNDLDGGFADVYSGPELIREVRLDNCPVAPLGVDVEGRWLAVVCETTDVSDTRDVFLRLLRIENIE